MPCSGSHESSQDILAVPDPNDHDVTATVCHPTSLLQIPWVCPQDPVTLYSTLTSPTTLNPTRKTSTSNRTAAGAPSPARRNPHRAAAASLRTTNSMDSNTSSGSGASGGGAVAGALRAAATALARTFSSSSSGGGSRRQSTDDGAAGLPGSSHHHGSAATAAAADGAAVDGGDGAGSGSGLTMMNAAGMVFAREMGLSRGGGSGFSSAQQRHMSCYRTFPNRFQKVGGKQPCNTTLQQVS